MSCGILDDMPLVTIKLVTLPGNSSGMLAQAPTVPRSAGMMASAVVNPYQPPTEQTASFSKGDTLRARFELTNRMLRFAESKYLLTRRGGRLTIASLIIVALSVVACFPWDLLQGIPIMARQIALMLIATIVYLSLIWQTRITIRSRLEEHGFIHGALMEVAITTDRVAWAVEGRGFTMPLSEMGFMWTDRGFLMMPALDVFFLVPRRAELEGLSYRKFVKILKTRKRDADNVAQS
ncbi:MAG: hypothetical protein AAFX06_01865 [Planctomycetota bacterium]